MRSAVRVLNKTAEAVSDAAVVKMVLGGGRDS